MGSYCMCEELYLIDGTWAILFIISMTASGVDVKSCQHFNSNTFPLKVVLNSAENDGGVIQIIYKAS